MSEKVNIYDDVAVSATSIREIAIKRSLGRMDIELEELLSSMDADGFTELLLRFAHSSDSTHFRDIMTIRSIAFSSPNPSQTAADS